MHVLYVHQNFPAQFGHVARELARRPGWRCSFVSRTPVRGLQEGIDRIPYRVRGGATPHNHFCSRTFENAVWHCVGVYDAMKSRPDVRPDLIVAHSAFGSSLFLREIYPSVPVVNFFEFFYHAHNSDMDFRFDLGWPVAEEKYLRSYCRNAMILLDLNNCQLGYTPTHYQKSALPPHYQRGPPPPRSQEKRRFFCAGTARPLYPARGGALPPPVGSRVSR